MKDKAERPLSLLPASPVIAASYKTTWDITGAVAIDIHAVADLVPVPQVSLCSASRVYQERSPVRAGGKAGTMDSMDSMAPVT